MAWYPGIIGGSGGSESPSDLRPNQKYYINLRKDANSGDFGGWVFDKDSINDDYSITISCETVAKGIRVINARAYTSDFSSESAGATIKAYAAVGVDSYTLTGSALKAAITGLSNYQYIGIQVGCYAGNNTTVYSLIAT